MGEVYLAEDTTLKRQIALKVLPPDLATSQERLERFQREAETLAALDHPNIVTIHSVEEAEGVRFLTMQLVEGKRLSELIPAGGMPLDEIFEIALPLTDALGAAHERGVVHRDLKPGNIMVADDGRVKVLDFGLVKLRQEETDAELTHAQTEPLTEEGRILGTVPYMSPEQLEGKRVDSWTDIFSLGVILYEMSTGERPFHGESSVSLISSILKDTPREVDTTRPELPHHLGRIIRRCLEKDPGNRYQASQDVLIELRDLRREVDTTTASSIVVSTEEAVRRPSTASVFWLIAALSVLVAGSFAVWHYVVPPGEVKRDPVQTASKWAARIANPEARTLFDQSQQYERQAATLARLQLAEWTMRRALELEPDNPYLQAELAYVLSRRQRAHPAQEIRDEAWLLAKKVVEADPSVAAGWVAKGMLLLQEDRAEDAADAALKAKESEPGDLRAHVLLGQALIGQGNESEGLAVLRDALELEGGPVIARHALATALLRIGELEEAGSEYRTLLELAPGHVRAMNNLAGTYLMTGSSLEAVPLLRRVLELDPDEWAAANLGTAYYYLNRMEDAIDAYLQAYRIDPDEPFIQGNLGDAYTELGDQESARNWYLRAIESCDRRLAEGGAREDILITRSLSEAKVGRLHKATQTIRTLLEEKVPGQGSGELLYTAAQIHALAGDRAAMMDFAERAIRAGYPRAEFLHAPEFKNFQEDPAFRELLLADHEDR